jgi:hypothetical protein
VLAQVREAGAGQILQIILNFSGNLSALINDPGLWGVIFYFVLWISRVDEILPLFLFFHHCIFPKETITGRWSKRVRNCWDKFARGMWQIIENDSQLHVFCLDKGKPDAFSHTLIGKHRRSKSLKGRWDR